MGSGDEASRPYLRFGKRSTSNDFVSKEEVSDNILENQDQDEDKIKGDSLPLNRPTRDAEYFESPTNNDEGEAVTNSKEEWQETEDLDQWLRPTRSFIVRPTRSFTMRPTRSAFIVRPTRSFMARPTRSQFMVRPTRASTAKRAEEVSRRSKDIFLMR